MGEKLSSEAAKKRALEYMRSTEEYGNQWVVSSAEERDWGWVVVTVTTEFARTGDFKHTVPGHGPLAVMHSGEVRPFPSLPRLREKFELELEALDS